MNFIFSHSYWVAMIIPIGCLLLLGYIEPILSILDGYDHPVGFYGIISLVIKFISYDSYYQVLMDGVEASPQVLLLGVGGDIEHPWLFFSVFFCQTWMVGPVVSLIYEGSGIY